MNKYKLSSVFYILFVLSVCLVSDPSFAEVITWEGPGAPGTTGTIWTVSPNYSTFAPTQNPSGNTVNINNTIAEKVMGGVSIGTPQDQEIYSLYNTVNINNTNVQNDIYGSYVYNDNFTTLSEHGESSRNAIVVDRSNITGSLIGGFVRNFTGRSEYNTIYVKNSNVSEHIFGGRLLNFASGNNGTSNNKITVENGSIGGVIFGGYVYYGDADDDKTATSNTVTLKGSTVFTKTTDFHFSGITYQAGSIYGGSYNSSANPYCDTFTGNTLNIVNYTGSSVTRVSDFDYYNFLFSKSALQPLVAQDVIFGFNYSGSPKPFSTISVNFLGGTIQPKIGKEIRIIEAQNIFGNINDTSTITGKLGATALVEMQLEKTSTAVTATIVGVHASPQSKALSEGRLAGLASVNQGQDFIANNGIEAAIKSFDDAENLSFSTFALVQGGSSRYNTGSHIDLNSSTLLAGFAANKKASFADFLLGVFFEAGWGNYDSYNSFAGYGSVNGDGNTNYKGGGLLGRITFNQTGPGNLYVDGSLRTGYLETDFSTSDITDVQGKKAHYDSGSAYYGAHTGLGYQWNILENSILDISAKYLWTHQENDSVSVSGDPVYFEDSNSRRIRTGARLSHTLTSESGRSFIPFIGAAYEYEFDGKAKATTYDIDIESPTLRGSTGIGELGIEIKPFIKEHIRDLSFHLGVQGYTGVREGFSGTLQAEWTF